MKFEIFTSQRSRKGDYSISIAKLGVIGFTSGFYQKEALSKFRYVRLAYDRHKEAVGFIFSNQKEEGSYTVIDRYKHRSGAIVARSFFGKYGINIQETVSFEPKLYHDSSLGKVFYISLKKPIKKDV